ncbi:protein phosphatase 1 regulatory subunit 3C-like [Oculina patagonica]
MKKDEQASCEDSGPTSPPSRVKRVSFADLVGLKLEFVKTITPCSSVDNLSGEDDPWNSKDHCDTFGNLPERRVKCLLPCFLHPFESKDRFMKRVYSQNVCLEYIFCKNFVVTGLIRVTNLSFNKEVTVRVTLDGWETCRDIWADYMSTCSDGKTEKFSFRITVPHDFEVNQCIEFAIRYRVWNQEFWDNNNRNNYHVQCLEVLSEQC